MISFDDIQADLSFLESWEDRLSYIIDLGKELQPLGMGQKNTLTKVEGCTAQVWLIPRLEDDRFFFLGASDAMIVQGLIAVLLALVNGKTAVEIQNLDILDTFKTLGLESHLSAQRSNGLHAMAVRIKTLAQT